MTMRLSECQVGGGGRITRVDGEGLQGQRLMELGFVEGTHVRVLRIAPFGDPLEIKMPQSRVSLRHADAARIELTP